MALTRREFFRKALGHTVKATTAGVVGLSFIGTHETCGDMEKRDNPVDPHPIEEQGEYSEDANEVIIDKTASGQEIKLYGVSHTRDFAKAKYDQMEDVVRNASIVLSESKPGRYKSKSSTNDGKCFFGTLDNLCMEHNKPIIHLDSQSSLGVLTDIGSGIAGGCYSYKHAKGMQKELSKSDLYFDRRTAIKEGIKSAAGAYLLVSSFLPGMVIKAPLYGEDTERKFFSHERFYFNHIVDQRNVQLTQRVKELPELLGEEYFENGDYILAVFGAGHMVGLDYYLDHPTTHHFKKTLYKFTYDLIDNDAINLFSPEDGRWIGEPLN